MNGKTLKIVFTLSVLLNVLLAGYGAGMMIRWHKSPHAWMEEAQRDGMSAEARNLMAEEFRRAHEEIVPLTQVARSARQEIVKALSAPEFNAGQFDAALEDLRKAQQEIMARKMQATRDIAQKLSQDERAKLAGHFAKSYSRKWNRYPGKHDFPPPPGEGEEPGASPPE